MRFCTFATFEQLACPGWRSGVSTKNRMEARMEEEERDHISRQNHKFCQLMTKVNVLSEGVRHFRSVVMDAGSHGTTAHAHQWQCCRFQGYPKAVPSRMKLTMACMNQHPWQRIKVKAKGSRRVTSYFYIDHADVISSNFLSLTKSSLNASETRSSDWIDRCTSWRGGRGTCTSTTTIDTSYSLTLRLKPSDYSNKV